MSVGTSGSIVDGGEMLGVCESIGVLMMIQAIKVLILFVFQSLIVH